MNCSLDDSGNDKSLLEKAGFAASDVSEWSAALPELRNDLKSDSTMCVKFWDLAQRLRAKLPRRTQRTSNDAAASDLIHRKERDLRERFLGFHVEELYGKLTAAKSKFLRIEELMPEAAKLVPGLTPSVEALSAERTLPLKEKEGLEIDHGILLSHILAHPGAGRHLCHAMLQPRTETLDLLPRLTTDGLIDLGTA